MLTGVERTAVTIRNGMVVAHTTGGFLILENSELDISYEFGGIHIGDRLEFNSGWGQQPTTDWYQVGVVPEARQLVTNRQNTGDPSRTRSGSNGGELHNHGIAHTHSFTVNLDPPFKKAEIWADGNLVSPPGPPDILAAPGGLEIIDNAQLYGSTREYKWSASADAVAYQVNFFHGVYATPSEIALVLGGARPADSGLVSSWVEDTSIVVPVALAEESSTHLIMEELAVTEEVSNIRTITYHGFNVIAIGENPHRFSPTSIPKSRFYVELINAPSS